MQQYHTKCSSVMAISCHTIFSGFYFKGQQKSSWKQHKIKSIVIETYNLTIVCKLVMHSVTNNHKANRNYVDALKFLEIVQHC